MYRLLLILLLSFSFAEEIDPNVVPCEGTCFSEDEVINITNNIKELEFKLEKGLEIEANLNSQIQSYVEQEKLNQQLINDYKKQLELKNDMIDLVKPKWYHNRYLWFGLGVFFTAGSVHMAGQIN